MNVLKALNENKFNDILMDVDTIEVISPCTLRVKTIATRYKIKGNNTFNGLPFRCILKSIRTNNVVKLDNVLSLQITALYDECKMSGAIDDTIKVNKGSICTLELMNPLSTEQMINLVSHTDSLFYNERLFNL